MPVREFGVVVANAHVYGVFPVDDARRVAAWLTAHGNTVTVTHAAITGWPPIPHPGARRLTVRNPLGAAPEYREYTLNTSLTDEPKWERRDDGRLVESLSHADLVDLTERLLAERYRLAQYPE